MQRDFLDILKLRSCKNSPSHFHSVHFIFRTVKTECCTVPLRFHIQVSRHTMTLQKNDLCRLICHFFCRLHTLFFVQLRIHQRQVRMWPLPLVLRVLKITGEHHRVHSHERSAEEVRQQLRQRLIVRRRPAAPRVSGSSPGTIDHRLLAYPHSPRLL